MNALIPAVLLLAQITGGEFIHITQPGESLTAIGARYGVDVHVLAEQNELKAPHRLQIGQLLRIDNRHIVPRVDDSRIVVNIAQRMLFHFGENRSVRAWPVAAGKNGWRTPLGPFEILTKKEKPTWNVPASIQEEMRRSGAPVLTRVPPSPQNPLGDYWIGLSLPGIGIHGTNAPASIYKLATHGCLRLHPKDIAELFSMVEVGMGGRIIYQPVLIARSGNSVFLEVHADIYGREPAAAAKVFEMARAEGFEELLDPALVEKVIRRQDGIARDVTKR